MVMHPLRHFVSAPDGTNDALILRDIEDQIGSYAESLTSEAKLAFLAVLSRYLYFKQWVVPDYSVGEALASTQMEADTTPETADIWDIMLTLEGISKENALGLLQFIAVAENHCEKAGKPAGRTCHCRDESAAVIDPGRAWLLRLPKEQFTMPLFSFGQQVQSQDREIRGRIVGMEFALDGSEQARYISPGWHYQVANEVRASSSPNKRRVYVDSLPESELIISCGGYK